MRPPGHGHPQPDPELSLALLHHDTPVGWVLLHRTGADAVRYSSLFVVPTCRRSAARA